MKPKYVLDASGVLRGALDFSSGDYLITPSVLSEIAEDTAKTAVEEGIRSDCIKIAEPGGTSLRRASEAASATGDLGSLSQADLDVLAVALDWGLAVISDDYAVQNVAAELGLRVSKTVHDGIKKRVKWVWACGGCGKRMGGPGVCEVCGHKAVKKPG